MSPFGPLVFSGQLVIVSEKTRLRNRSGDSVQAVRKGGMEEDPTRKRFGDPVEAEGKGGLRIDPIRNRSGDPVEAAGKGGLGKTRNGTDQGILSRQRGKAGWGIHDTEQIR